MKLISNTFLLPLSWYYSHMPASLLLILQFLSVLEFLFSKVLTIYVNSQSLFQAELQHFEENYYLTLFLLLKACKTVLTNTLSKDLRRPCLTLLHGFLDVSHMTRAILIEFSIIQLLNYLQ